MKNRLRLAPDDFGDLKQLIFACNSDRHLLPSDLDHLASIIAKHVPSRNVSMCTLACIQQMHRGRFWSRVIRIIEVYSSHA